MRKLVTRFMFGRMYMEAKADRAKMQELAAKYREGRGQ
ncbi:hypothetical protein SEA_OCTOBIEN14_132 [Gordonia phage Octobien14]|uniref:Uncharacterized protein n=1 Tax=Gordonia phage Octobien14 TaxID=2483673 RepID=A0A3G3MAV8_9CAUD|nr:hypothetical protein L3Y22_gp112 [Gordonia phage Octobien14]AYR03267.1 hypothetical protein SEA_OCTOBIEN14_132 [Gordonia phage Octobien14]